MASDEQELRLDRPVRKNFRPLALAILRSPVLILAVAAGVLWLIG